MPRLLQNARSYVYRLKKLRTHSDDEFRVPRVYIPTPRARRLCKSARERVGRLNNSCSRGVTNEILYAHTYIYTFRRFHLHRCCCCCSSVIRMIYKRRTVGSAIFRGIGASRGTALTLLSPSRTFSPRALFCTYICVPDARVYEKARRREKEAGTRTSRVCNSIRRSCCIGTCYTVTPRI